jgi:hypothetical protein
MRVVALLLAIGCSKVSAPEVDVDPVTRDQVTAFAVDLVKVVQPCDEAKLRTLIDDKAMAARFQKGESSFATASVAEQLKRDHIAARVLCAWQAKADDYKLLRVRDVDGQPRPLFRRTGKNPRSGLSVAGYDELLLGVTRDDHEVRIIDVYSYVQGQWLTETLRGMSDVMLDSVSGEDEARALVDKIKRARTLQDSGQPGQALELVDSMPPKVRKSRALQTMRVALASVISQEAYKAALDEVDQTFPNDPSVALLEIDGAFLRGDLDAALRYIDLVDKALGGDPWQNALRAEALSRRKKPGDLVAAEKAATLATTAEPALAKGWWAMVDVQLAKQDWTAALAAMDELVRRFGAKFDDAVLRKSSVFAGLVATREYAAWHAKRASN